ETPALCPSPLHDALPISARRLQMVEVHTGGHKLIIAVPQIPGRLTAESQVVVNEHIDQHAAHRVDADDRLRWQVDELQHLLVGRSEEHTSELPSPDHLVC